MTLFEPICNVLRNIAKDISPCKKLIYIAILGIFVHSEQ